MKQMPQETRVIQNMRPGVLSREGFLGSDNRALQEILDTDDAEVRRLGLTHEQIASKLQEMKTAAMATYGTPTRAGGLTVVYREAMGRIPCPWGHGEVFPKGEIEVTDPDTGQQIRYTPLSVHLVGEHGFYQGRGSRYRLEPRQVQQIFDLQPIEQGQ